MHSMLRSTRSLTSSVRCHSTPPPPTRPKYTGGGGNRSGGNNNNNNNNNNNKNPNDGDGHEASMEAKKTALENAYVNSDAHITVASYLAAMRRRWGKAYMSTISIDEDQSASILISQKPIQERRGRMSLAHQEIAELEHMVEVLNAYGLGPQVIEYIKFFASIKEPGRNNNAPVSTIPLDIPMEGPRLTEWVIEPDEDYDDAEYTYMVMDEDGMDEDDLYMDDDEDDDEDDDRGNVRPIIIIL